MKAIVTKYHPAGNVRGSRYGATDNDGNRIIHDPPMSLSGDECHDSAAVALCHKMNWHGTLVRAWLGKGSYVYVWNDPDAYIEVAKA